MALTEVVLGGVITAAIVGLSSIAWQEWRRLAHLRAELPIFSRRILNADLPKKACGILVDLKAFLDANSKLLREPKSREFYQLWLTNPLLAIGGHGELITQDSGPALQQLKADAIRLLG